jgi:uncharacterized protein (TIGR02246 family)
MGRPKISALDLRWDAPVTVSTEISSKSWAAFAISAALLLIFAFLGARQFRDRPATEESAQTPAVKSPDETTEAAKQAEDVAPEVWESSAKKDIAPESTVKELVQAWNKRDAEKIAALFLPDGVLRIPTGAELKSREEIRNTIAKHHSGILSETTLTNTVDGISNTDGDNAIVKGTYQLNGIKVLGFSTSSKGTYEFLGTKRNGRWLIAKAEVTRE